MVGQLLGNYLLVRQLGEGGMGAVFEAVHQQIGRRVAIKVLHREFSQKPEIVNRFFNEARAVNIIQHPGIVGVFEFGQAPDGSTYIVMEYLAGESLSARLLRYGGRLGQGGLHLCRQLASALAAAHEKGIVHRDLKPGNVMIVSDAESLGGERAKLLDFGVAKVAAEYLGPGKDLLKTRSGVIMGTPMYMAPEQCRGAAGVDDRADVYSLGVLTYQVLAGRPPFVADGVAEMIAMHMLSSPPPLLEIEPGLPEPLGALVHSMLAKDPRDRPSMIQVVQELERLGVKSTHTVPIPLPEVRATGHATVISDAGAHDPADAPSGGSIDGVALKPKSAMSSRAARIIVPALTAALLSVLGVGLYERRLGNPAAQQQPEPPPLAQPVPPQVPPLAVEPPRPVRITWQLTTTPPGAEVVRVADGVVLGTTPWRSERTAGKGHVPVQVRLRHEGFLDKELTLAEDRDFVAELVLAPVPQRTSAQGPSAESDKQEGAHRSPAPEKKARGPHKPKEPSDDDLEIGPLR